MIRLLAIGLIGIGATLVGMASASYLSAPRDGNSKKEPVPAAEVIKLEPASVPILRDGKIDGYVVARVAVTVPEADAKSQKPFLTAIATEAVFRVLYQEAAFDFRSMKAADVAQLSDRIVKLANGRLGRSAFTTALFENLNFVTAAEVRARAGGAVGSASE